MTTMALVDETLARFDGKSPRDSYKQVCGELKVHMQRDIYSVLPEKPVAWHHIFTLDLGTCLLGTRGCMAILPIITVSTLMRKLVLRSCGLSDDFAIALCALLQNHPSIRSVDLSDNELITVYSAPHIINVMRNNKNMIAFDVRNTHVGDNVCGIISDLGQRNLHGVLHYYEDRYFRMKDIFNYMDADGTGWVLLKSLVLNCPYPVLQEQFVERIATKNPRKRSDNTISINTFLQLIYMNYKTEAEIGAWANGTIDDPYVFTISNWKQMLRAVERYNQRSSSGEASGHRLVVQLPNDFHRWRLRDYIMTHEDADVLLEGAMQILDHATAMAEDGSVFSNSSFLVKPTEQEGEQQTAEAPSEKNPHVIPVAVLLRAAKSTLALPPSVTKPLYQFYTDRDAAYVPEIMRNGSRLFSLSRLSNVFGSGASGTESTTSAETVADPSDPPRTFSLPSSMVKMMVEFFNKEFAKLPQKKPSVIPDTPRTRREKAMEKSAIPVPTFLSAEFVTDLEKVCPRLLADYYSSHALLIEESTITLQEMVNVLDEMYVQCRIDRVFSLADIEAMADPMKDPSLASFIATHFDERDEPVPLLESDGQGMRY